MAINRGAKAYRKMAMEFLQEESEEYRKEFAHALQQQGAFDEAEELLKRFSRTSNRSARLCHGSHESGKTAPHDRRQTI